jgi:hypothetical protein|tara:strand:+ start:1048 stop:1386 length:339 start_codon:yes stop_codon:yes gene_type:complete
MTHLDNLFELGNESSLYDLTNKDSHQSLYIAVVLQALLDLSKPKFDKEKSNIQVQRDQASSWVFKTVGVTCRDFEEICSYAGLEPTAVRKVAYTLINSKDSKNVRNSIKALL